MGSSCSSTATEQQTATHQPYTAKSATQATIHKEEERPPHPLEAPSRTGQRKVYRSVVPTPEASSIGKTPMDFPTETPPHPQPTAPTPCGTSQHLQQPDTSSGALRVGVKSHNLSQDSDILRVESVSDSTSLLSHGHNNNNHQHVHRSRVDSLQSSSGVLPRHTQLLRALSHSQDSHSLPKSTMVTPQSSYSPAASEFNWGHAAPRSHGATSPIIEANITNDTTSNTFPHPDEEEEEDDEFQATLHQLATAEWRSNEPTPTNTPPPAPLTDIKQTTRMWSASSQSAEVDEAALITYMKAGRDAFGMSLQSDGSRPSQRISDSMAANAGNSQSLLSGPSPLHLSRRSDSSLTAAAQQATTGGNQVAAPASGDRVVCLTLLVEPSSLSGSHHQ